MLKLYDRTFGLEIEFGNVVRDRVNLPAGWKWSPDERFIVNSDATKCTPTGDRGGELNTRPLPYGKEGLAEVQDVVRQCFEAEGVMMWNTGFDGHLYIGDLGLEELKRVFALAFYSGPFINEVFDLGPWFDVSHLMPTPTIDFHKRAQKCETIEAFKNVFANSSNRGHYRFQVNVMSYFTTKTLEYRIFNPTRDIEETAATIEFMYKWLDCALTKTDEDFKAIKSADDFRRVFEIEKPLPKKVEQLVFAESHLQKTRSIAKAFPLSRKITNAIQLDTGNNLTLVNPYHYQTCLSLYTGLKMRVYNANEYYDIVHRLATGNLELSYHEHFAFLNNKIDGTRERQLTLFLIFARMQKYNVDMDYGLKEFMAYVNAIDDSIVKIHATACELVKMFEQVEVHKGTLIDALNDGSGDDVLYQQKFNSKTNSAVTALRKYSDYDAEWERIMCKYDRVDQCVGDRKLLIASKSDFLPYNKIAKDTDTTLYSNKESYWGMRRVVQVDEQLMVETPEDDWELTMDTVLKVNEIRPAHFGALQRKFVKKVAEFQTPKLCYTLSADGMLLGGFGFDYSKDDDYKLFLLSDFATNNNVRLLSKLVLFVIKSKEVKRMLERKCVERLTNCYTKVYTTRPVSMKYRGAFKKLEHDGKALKYEFDFGSVNSIEDAKREYLKRKQ